jgi:exoribonuclease-2
MQPGTIVTYFDKDKITCGVCLEPKGDKWHLLSEHNRTLNLSENRILHHYEKKLNLQSSQGELLKQLKECILKEEGLKRSLDTEELWQLLHDEGERFDLQALSEFAFGAHPTAEQVAATFRALFEDKIHFKFKDGTFIIHPPHQVQQILMKLQRDAEREKELEEGSTWLRKKWDGVPVEDPPRKDHYLALLRELAIFGPDAPECAQGKQLFKRAQLNHPDTAFKLLVKMGEIQEDENLLIHRYGIPTHWTPEALHESEKLYQDFNLPCRSIGKKRRDLTALPLFSIDSETTRDIDDALSIEMAGTSCQVGIHIADVAAHIAPGSQLDKEAAERTASLYLPDGTIPMFPPLLSEDALSLVDGQNRFAISIIIHFDHAYAVTEYAIFPSVIKVRHRYTYTQSDAQIERDTNLSHLLNLTQHLRAQRIKAGALLLPIPELTVKVSDTGAIRVSRRERETPSEVIVSELMILTNWLCATFLNERGIPLVYRNQLEPRETVEGAGKDDLFLNYRQRRLLNRMTLSTTPGSHSSLGLKPYSTFTSPIRRYLDLIAQRQLRSIILEERKPYSEEELRQMIVDTEMNQAKINLVQEQRHNYWLFKYLEGKVGESFSALVVRKLLHRAELLIIDYLLETSIPSSPADSLSPGTTITLKLEHVDTRRGVIRVLPVI